MRFALNFLGFLIIFLVIDRIILCPQSFPSDREKKFKHPLSDSLAKDVKYN